MWQDVWSIDYFDKIYSVRNSLSIYYDRWTILTLQYNDKIWLELIIGNDVALGPRITLSP